MATTPRIADIGAVPDGLGEDLTRFLQQVQRLLRTGVQTGGLSGSGSGSSSSGGGSTIIGGGTSGSGIPGMDDPTPPPTPSGVTVGAGLSYVFFETAPPVFAMGAGYDRTRVYVAQYPASALTPPTFGDAVLAYEFVGQVGAMPAEPATRMAVWLKWRTRAGVDSTTPEGGINGHIVETGQDVGLLLEALAGSVTSSALDQALRSRIDLVDGPTTMAGSVSARVQAEQQARQTADTAIANQVTTLTAAVTQNNATLTAAVQTEALARANTDNGLLAQYTVKVDTAGLISGFGLASTAGSAAPSSMFGVRANTFYVAPPAVAQAAAPTTNLYRGFVWLDTSVTPNVTRYYTGSAWSTAPQALPFSVQSSPVTLNGVVTPPGVYMDAAYINNLTAMVARLGNAWIDNAMIANVAADKIVAGSLAVGRYVQSSNYSAGAQGWRIHADGSAEFGATSIRGQLTASQINTEGLTIKVGGQVILGAGAGLSAAYAPAMGANLVPNADFMRLPTGDWPVGTWGVDKGGWYLGDNSLTGIDRVGCNLNPDWNLFGGATLYIRQIGRTGNGGYAEFSSTPIPVREFGWYILSCYSGAHRAEANVFVYAYSAAGTLLAARCFSTNAMEAAGGPLISGYKRQYEIGQMPAGASYVRIRLRKNDTIAGQADSWGFFTNVQLESVNQGTSEPGPFSPGPAAKITAANASTWIDSAAIGSAQIANASITDAHIANLNAEKITAGSITTDKLSIGSVSSLTTLIVPTMQYLWNPGNGTTQAIVSGSILLTPITKQNGDVTIGGSVDVAMNSTAVQLPAVGYAVVGVKLRDASNNVLASSLGNVVKLSKRNGYQSFSFSGAMLRSQYGAGSHQLHLYFYIEQYDWYGDLVGWSATISATYQMTALESKV